MDSSFEITSIASNGSVISKRELLTYLANIIRPLNEFKEAMDRKKEREPMIGALVLDSKRREFPIYPMLPPRGIAALSRKRRREYQKWVEEAPHREAHQREENAKEDKRVATVEKELLRLREEQQEDTRIAREARERYERLIAQDIIPREYCAPVPLMSIAKILLCSRAHTLTDAINIYCQDQHWRNMETIAQEQKQELLNAQYRLEAQQMEQMAQMQRMQREHNRQVQETLDETRRAAQDAKFYSEMNFLFNLFE